MGETARSVRSSIRERLTSEEAPGGRGAVAPRTWLAPLPLGDVEHEEELRRPDDLRQRPTGGTGRGARAGVSRTLSGRHARRAVAEAGAPRAVRRPARR